jgi:hypothetical protein
MRSPPSLAFRNRPRRARFRQGSNAGVDVFTRRVLAHKVLISMEAAFVSRRWRSSAGQRSSTRIGQPVHQRSKSESQLSQQALHEEPPDNPTRAEGGGEPKMNIPGNRALIQNIVSRCKVISDAMAVEPAFEMRQRRAPRLLSFELGFTWLRQSLPPRFSASAGIADAVLSE